MKLAFAMSFAATAHAGQTRKFTGLPYITHPLAVAELVRTYGGTEEQVIAAILHDVVEDTPVPRRAIYDAFGPTVALIVDDLTRPADRSLEEDVDFWRRRACRAARLVKLADIVDNTNDVRDLDRLYAAIYLPKKRAIVDAIDPGYGSLQVALWRRAVEQCA